MLFFLNIGGGELFIIALVVIMFFGSKKIPEIARMIGKGISEVKNATNDIQQEIKSSVPDLSKVKDSMSVQKQMKSYFIDELSTTPSPQPGEKEHNPSETTSEENTIKPANSIHRNN